MAETTKERENKRAQKENKVENLKGKKRDFQLAMLKWTESKDRADKERNENFKRSLEIVEKVDERIMIEQADSFFTWLTTSGMIQNKAGVN